MAGRMEVEQRNRIVEWCFANGFQISSNALAYAILYKHASLVDRLMQCRVPITPKVMQCSLLTYDFAGCKRLYAGRECLASSIWTTVCTSECEDAEEKMKWLLEIGCPVPSSLIASIIDDAPRCVLDWLVQNGVAQPCMLCWSALSNRYHLDDTDEMLDWLKANGCPKDPDVAARMDLCRPYAGMIIDYLASESIVDK